MYANQNVNNPMRYKNGNFPNKMNTIKYVLNTKTAKVKMYNAGGNDCIIDMKDDEQLICMLKKKFSDFIFSTNLIPI